jgi:hypothetical protein
MTMQLIETKTLGTAAASIEFTSIPQDGTDLILLASLRSSRSGVDETVFCDLYVNGGTTNLSSRNLFGYSTTASSGTGVGALGGAITVASATSNTFSNTSIYFANYSSTTTAKSFSTDSSAETNSSFGTNIIASGLYNSNTPITSLTILRADSSLVAGSTVSLYKITKGSDGIVTTS